MGRLKWWVKKGICESEDVQLEFVLSTCTTYEFTCDNGECVNLDLKCNMEIDCTDKSDEAYCDNLLIPPSYRKV